MRRLEVSNVWPAISSHSSSVPSSHLRYAYKTRLRLKSLRSSLVRTLQALPGSARPRLDRRCSPSSAQHLLGHFVKTKLKSGGGDEDVDDGEDAIPRTVVRLVTVERG